MLVLAALQEGEDVLDVLAPGVAEDAYVVDDFDKVGEAFQSFVEEAIVLVAS